MTPSALSVKTLLDTTPAMEETVVLQVEESPVTGGGEELEAANNCQQVHQATESDGQLNNDASTVDRVQQRVSVDSQLTADVPDCAPVEQDSDLVERDDAVTDGISGDQDTVPIEQESVLVRQHSDPVEQESVPESVPVEQESIPVEQESIPVDQESVPVEPEPVLIEQETVPTEQDSVSVEQDSVPVEQESVPVEQESISVEQDSVSVELESVLVEQETIAVEQDSVLVEHDSDPAETCTVREDDNTKASTSPGGVDESGETEGAAAAAVVEATESGAEDIVAPSPSEIDISIPASQKSQTESSSNSSNLSSCDPSSIEGVDSPTNNVVNENVIDPNPSKCIIISSKNISGQNNGQPQTTTDPSKFNCEQTVNESSSNLKETNEVTTSVTDPSKNTNLIIASHNNRNHVQVVERCVASEEEVVQRIVGVSSSDVQLSSPSSSPASSSEVALRPENLSHTTTTTTTSPVIAVQTTGPIATTANTTLLPVRPPPPPPRRPPSRTVLPASAKHRPVPTSGNSGGPARKRPRTVGPHPSPSTFIPSAAAAVVVAGTGSSGGVVVNHHQRGARVVTMPVVNGSPLSPLRLVPVTAPANTSIHTATSTTSKLASLMVGEGDVVVMEEEDGCIDNVISIPEGGKGAADLESLCTQVVGPAGMDLNMLANMKAEEEEEEAEHDKIGGGGGGVAYISGVSQSSSTQQQLVTITEAGGQQLTFAINGQNNLLAAAMANNNSSGGGGHSGGGELITHLATSSGLVPIRINGPLTSALLTTPTKTEQQQQHQLDGGGGGGGGGLVASAPPRQQQQQPRTEILLQTAKEVLQLPDDPAEFRRVFTADDSMEGCTLMITGGEQGGTHQVEEEGGGTATILSTSGHEAHATHPQEMTITEDGQMEVTDETGTFIIEPVTSEEYFNEDPNIMWIQETVEVEQESYDNLPNMVIILNPNGTVNEELMLANGMNIETIKAVTDAATGGLNLQTVVPITSSSSSSSSNSTLQQAPAADSKTSSSSLQQLQTTGSTHPSIQSLQHPIPRKLLTGVQPMTARAPRTILESAAAAVTTTTTSQTIQLSPQQLHAAVTSQTLQLSPQQLQAVTSSGLQLSSSSSHLHHHHQQLQVVTSSALQQLVSSSSSSQQLQAVVTSSSPPTSAPHQLIHASQIKSERENVRSVILHPKHDALVLDDIKDPSVLEVLTADSCYRQQQQQLTSQIININGTQHIITSAKPLPELKRLNQQTLNSLHMTPLGTLDLSLPKKPDPSVLEQHFNPDALVSENAVLKVLDDSEFLKRKAAAQLTNKIRRQRIKDENGNPTSVSQFIPRKTTSLGALGQALHGTCLGIPRDSRENAVQICPICKFQATTKNPYRHLQDHLARVHFKDRIAAELPTKKPYICPMEGCDGKNYPDWQAVMRHYIGKKHGILDKYVKEELAQIRRDNGGRIPGTNIRPGVDIII